MRNPILPFYKQAELYLERGEGCYLFDGEGNKYVDFESGDWAACLGHSHPEICKVMNEQANKLMHDGLKFKSALAEQLSLELLELLDMENGQSVFLNSGSEAVNLAITLAQKITKREHIVKIEGSYLSAFGYGHLHNSKHINIPINNNEFINSIDFTKVAAFVFEAGSSHGLVNFASTNLIDSTLRKAKENDSLLIANEVTLGFGRTGKWFGFQHYNFEPDIVAMGKGLGNGYPISAVCVHNNVADLFYENQFRYAQSHQNDPLGCKLASEVIKILKRDKLVDSSKAVGNYISGELVKLQNMHPNLINEIRARGLLIAVELSSELQAERISYELLENGFIIGQTKNVLRLMPPLVIDEMEINRLLHNFKQVLNK